MGIGEKKGYDREKLKQLYTEYKVPFVPDYTGLHLPQKKIGLIVLAVIIVVTLLIGVFYVRASIGKPPTQSRHATSSPTIPNHPTNLTCPGMQPPTISKPPALDFCSPTYQGSVGGPAGSHIVLVGENFPAQPIAWFAIKNQNNISTPSPDCSSPGCFHLQQPEVQPLAQFATLYSWTWLSPAFPSAKGNYKIMAQFNGTQNSPVASHRAFTVTSSSPPCISVVVTTKPESDCSKQQVVTLHQGNKFEIDGLHWNLDWDKNTTQTNEQVIVSINCIQPQICSSSTLFSPFGSPVNPDGSFTFSETLSQVSTGKYEVIASNNMIQSIATPGGSTNTVANNALTFRMLGNTPAIILIVS